MNADEVYGEYLRAQSENRPVPSVDPADALGESDKPGGTLSEKPDSSLGQGSSVNSATLPRPGPPIAGGGPGGSDLEWFQPGYAAMQREGKGDDNGIVRDIATGVSRLPQNIVGGISTGVHNIFGAVDDLANWLNEMVDLNVDVPLTGIDALDKLIANPAAAIAGPPDVTGQLIDEPKSITGGLIKGISQFFTGYGAKGLTAGARAITGGIKSKVGRNIAESAIRGAGADAAVFNPLDPRISDILREKLELNDPITAYLASSPEDTAAEGRLKNALEGLLLGVGADSMIRLLVSAARYSKARIKRPPNVGGAVPPKAPADQVSGSQVGDQSSFENDVRSGKITPDTPGVDSNEVRAILEDQRVLGSGGEIGGGVTRGARGERASTTGQYIGAPRGIITPQALGGLRRKLQKITVKGEPGRFWYERSSRQILDAVGGDIDDADKLVQLIGIFSSGTDVSSNFNYALQAFTQAKAGLPIRSGRFPTRQSKAAQDVMDGISWGGRKTNNFYNNLMVHIDPKRVQGVTTDIWIMRAFGFKNPDGTPFGLKQKDGKAGLTRPTDAQYDFVEKEIIKIADEMGWEPQQVQAAIWVAEKAKFEGTPIAQAKFDFADALQNNLGQVSWESIPGRTSGHMPEMYNAPYRQQVEYHQAVSRVFLDDAGNDIIAKELGIPSPRDFEAPGYFEGKTSPGTQTEVALPRLYKGPAYGKIDDGAAALVDAYAAVRGILLKQDGVGWHRPFYNATIAASNGVEIRIGRNLSTGETKRLAKLIENEAGHAEYNPISSPLGTRIINFDHLIKISDGKGGFKPLVPDALKKNGGWIDENHLVENKEFHAIVRRALNRMNFDGGAKYDAKRFASQNGYLGNNWGVGKNGEGYLESSLKGRPDLQRKVRDIVEKLAPRIDDLDKDFSRRYGWTLNREINSGNRRGLTQKAILPAAALTAPLFLGGSDKSGAELNEGAP